MKVKTDIGKKIGENISQNTDNKELEIKLKTDIRKNKTGWNISQQVL